MSRCVGIGAGGKRCPRKAVAERQVRTWLTFGEPQFVIAALCRACGNPLWLRRKDLR